jgi:hypothetical protein
VNPHNVQRTTLVDHNGTSLLPGFPSGIALIATARSTASLLSFQSGSAASLLSHSSHVSVFTFTVFFAAIAI